MDWAEKESNGGLYHKTPQHTAVNSQLNELFQPFTIYLAFVRFHPNKNRFSTFFIF